MINPGLSTLTLSRQAANDYLHIRRLRLSYQILRPASLRGHITKTAIAAMLNGCAVGGASVDADNLPPMLTVPQAAELAGVTEKQIYAAFRRKRHRLPHFRITKRTILTTANFVKQWLDE